MEKKNPKTGKWEKVSDRIPPDAKEFTVPKLNKGEPYKFRVMAENDQGLSEPLETEKETVAEDPFGKFFSQCWCCGVVSAVCDNSHLQCVGLCRQA